MRNMKMSDLDRLGFMSNNAKPVSKIFCNLK